MKILHIAPTFYPAWAYGGVARAVYEIAKAQVKLNHQVTVFTTNALNKDEVVGEAEEEIDDIKVLRIRNLSNFLMWEFHTPTPFSRRFPKIDEFEIVHCHEYRTFLNFLAAKNLKDQKLIFSPWGTLPFNDSLVLYKKVFELLFLQNFKKSVDLALGQTKHELEVIEDNKIDGATKILPLGIETDFFVDLPERSRVRAELGIRDSDFVLVFLGRYSRVKGVGQLLEAFGKFAKDKQNIRLVLVGRDDGYLKEIESKILRFEIKDKVLLEGPLYEKERLKAYAIADGFVFTPTVYEETSTACLEALMSGVPVITTTQAEIPYLSKKDGVWQIENDVNSIVEAMEELHGIWIKKPFRVNKTKIKEYFDWNNIVKELIKYYRKVL